MRGYAEAGEKILMRHVDSWPINENYWLVGSPSNNVGYKPKGRLLNQKTDCCCNLFFVCKEDRINCVDPKEGGYKTIKPIAFSDKGFFVLSGKQD
jgi:hypothetical protein